MLKVRVHGRGGQGAVTAAALLSHAAFAEGRHAQAFPTFGSERTGAPVVAFCRIDDEPIRIHEPISEPDALIVQDATLLHQVNVFDGLRPEGYVLLNSSRTLDELGVAEVRTGRRPDRLLTVPATAYARRYLGQPRPNAALLGGFAALTGAVSLGSVLDAIRERFPGPVGEANAKAARDAFDDVAQHRRQLADA
ncbi:MAG TPA: 2-oxoacid:acceptor oxidoreductase family protein [Pseudonocardia sp.]|nr:2-oxoacid:acceptor oxidoreductase family protein [Pseudonocardia sp.]